MGAMYMTGGVPLRGEVEIGSAKNALLPILAACVLTAEPVTLRGCARITDVDNMLRILSSLGCRIGRQGRRICVDPGPARGYEMTEALSKRLRSSVFLLGPILSRFRRAVVTYPGGCEIGLRPIDLHLKGLRTLGVRIEEKRGLIYCDGSGLSGAAVQLDFPSVGATENLMMAAVLAPGETVIANAAREPEIVDLQDFLNALGAQVSGAGENVIRIRGVKALHGAEYTPIPDRICAGTLLCAAAMTHGVVTLRGARPDHMGAVLSKLSEAGCALETGADWVRLSAGERMLKPLTVSTQPYPGFPTDLQAQFMALCCTCEGASLIEENLFESRFAHAAELRRMGADITVRGRSALVRGGRKLFGADVEAKDLRGGAALVLAGLCAEGETRVEGVPFIDRGYEALEETLRALGANITRA